MRVANKFGVSIDIRAFHHAVLDDGPMPRSILHARIGS
jgi:uncharacterized protein (DUF885 family)